MKYDPPPSGKFVQFVAQSGLFRRFSQAFWEHAIDRIKTRGNCFSDFVGSGRRRIRYPIFQKNRDPYVTMMVGARNLRMKHWRAFGWQVPEQMGPGAGLGLVPRHLDYYNKITNMVEADWTDTGLSCTAFKMIPTITIRKYYNELPRMLPFIYGMVYTKEQMYNHLAWGIDPGNEKIEELLNPTDPEKRKQRQEELEIKRYLTPDIAASWEKDYKLKWPFPDDNVYRPTYNRGFNRRYWSKFYF